MKNEPRKTKEAIVKEILALPLPEGGPRASREELSSLLYDIIKFLRSPEGCPWDRTQTLTSVLPNLLEEVYELWTALFAGRMEEVEEEIGDVYLNALMFMVIAEDMEYFSPDQVLYRVIRKLYSRHSHVFGEARAANAEEALENWNNEKRKEHKPPSSISPDEPPPFSTSHIREHLSGIPPFEAAYLLQKILADYTFDWPTYTGPLEKTKEEIDEVEAVLEKSPHDRESLKKEIGDLLFSVLNLSRKLDIHPSEALLSTLGSILSRLESMEKKLKEKGISFQKSSPEELDSLWEAAKAEIED
ncbi:nucleoside triphosphate pyrophosphohydrolase [Spirochaeta thermophila]|uniref:NTP pyrophosphohydrolase MazG-like domain-containing protein n=1 Tax=Winmispira thermophila (strain ATCC 49972 / DSM 6192 / RI 19.B1) TaxID=665571 RepID=E0RSP9_WINT6|nr:nucleoside triphosphate pyrophosphohydrolase [Spirochaeta thermophila]ADN02036.1 hypothetical protein STHERM_c10910 [Spirochaeta thermophila DSM 6192]